jgi:hypothetical protein
MKWKVVQVRARINKHIATVRSFKHDNLLNMGHHFNGSDCSINNLVWTPLDKISDDIPKREAERLLQKLETLWIRRMCSMQPWGTNYIEVDTQVRTNPH